MEPGLALHEYLQFMIGQLVDRPDQASVIHEKVDGRHVYLIRVAQEDVGKVIGRNGFTISAIRSLFQAAAQRHRLKATLKIDESEFSAAATEDAP